MNRLKLLCPKFEQLTNPSRNQTLRSLPRLPVDKVGSQASHEREQIRLAGPIRDTVASSEHQDARELCGEDEPREHPHSGTRSSYTKDVYAYNVDSKLSVSAPDLSAEDRIHRMPKSGTYRKRKAWLVTWEWSGR